MTPTKRTETRVLTLSEAAWAERRRKIARVAAGVGAPSTTEERQSRAEENLGLVYELMQLRRTHDELEARLFGIIKACLSNGGKLPPD
jgi:hypothetical protein